MTTAADGWSEFDGLSELELWQSIVNKVEAVEIRRSLAAWVSDDGAAVSADDVDALEVGANMALLLAILRRFPDATVVKLDDEGGIPRARLMADLFGVRRDSAVADATPAPGRVAIRTRTPSDRRARHLAELEAHVQYLIETAGEFRAMAEGRRDDPSLAALLEKMADDNEADADRVADKILARS